MSATLVTTGPTTDTVSAASPESRDNGHDDGYTILFDDDGMGTKYWYEESDGYDESRLLIDYHSF